MISNSESNKLVARFFFMGMTALGATISSFLVHNKTCAVAENPSSESSTSMVVVSNNRNKILLCYGIICMTVFGLAFYDSKSGDGDNDLRNTGIFRDKALKEERWHRSAFCDWIVVKY